MSFKFPSFTLLSLQESLPKVDLESIQKSFQTLGKAVSQYSEHLKESLQPLTAKTQTLILSQLQQVQQLASANSHIEVSELPEEYLTLEANCDLLLNLFTELIHTTNDTYGTISYDYPPGNSAINKIKDANMGLMLANKFNQLKNVSTPQEMEKVLLGGSEEKKSEDDTVSAEVITAELPKTLFGHFAAVASRSADDFAKSSDPLSFALLQISSAYTEIATARLDQDKKIMTSLNHELVAILNEKFIKVNELRKRVYLARSDFDVARSKSSEDEEEENEELIAKEDELVSATEIAVEEMRKLLKPSQNVDLLKVLVTAQKEYFEAGAKKLAGLLTTLDKIEFKDDDE
ncbi:CIC11C00000003860 [Sungouiella intermedia]|uniref:CIC11C00000003860 n=1 Tax=Sungouiella intermedia TaxID=45354 RepID=A0A1L0BAY1_9ASCO|nr:CIC11C00000003860 [[Candida] intermedia]SGZ58237.1 CIC11C00000005210 [[Candida] intermedia]